MTRKMLSALLLGVIGTAILLGLGLWQVQRLDWKTAILDRIEERRAAAPSPVPPEPTERSDEYRRVRASGTLLPGEVHVYTAAPAGGVGYRVIAPMQIEDGRRILLDRGFVPIGEKDADRATGPLSVTGTLLWPDEAEINSSPPDLARNIWIARDVAAMSETLDTSPVLIVAETPTGREGPEPLPVSPDIPNNHLAYAVTWFGLALVWAGMTAYLLWRIKRRID